MFVIYDSCIIIIRSDPSRRGDGACGCVGARVYVCVRARARYGDQPMRLSYSDSRCVRMCVFTVCVCFFFF